MYCLLVALSLEISDFGMILRSNYLQDKKHGQVVK